VATEKNRAMAAKARARRTMSSQLSSTRPSARPSAWLAPEKLVNALKRVYCKPPMRLADAAMRARTARAYGAAAIALVANASSRSSDRAAAQVAASFHS
jgi:hypothetical protein